MTKASKEADPKISEEFELQQILCIHYLDQFSQFFVEALIDSSSMVHIIQASFAKKSGFCIYKTNVKAQKIDSSRRKTYKIIFVLFWVDDIDKKFCYFENFFLLADISMDITFGVFFLNLKNIEVKFNNWVFRWTLYTVAKIFLTTKQVELVRKKEFATAVFYLEIKFP